MICALLRLFGANYGAAGNDAKAPPAGLRRAIQGRDCWFQQPSVNRFIMRALGAERTSQPSPTLVALFAKAMDSRVLAQQLRLRARRYHRLLLMELVH
ncbi:MAG: hypothetical protein ACI9DC_003996 [Gammaproteobacteria bacterium]|jgi:hypothetical protein